MTYAVTITSTNGNKHSYKCGGASDQEALIYAGKIVEEEADGADPEAMVSITKDDKAIGLTTSVGDMLETHKTERQ